MNKKMFIIYAIVMNIVMSLTMSFTSALTHGGVDIKILMMIGISFVIGMLVTIFIPLDKISKWFSGLFKLKDNSIWAMLVGNILVNTIVTMILSFCMTNVALKFAFPPVFFAWIQSFPLMYLVSYIASFLTNVVWFKLVIPSVMKKRTKNV